MGKIVELNAEWQGQEARKVENMDIEIKIEFKHLLKPLEPEEYELLAESIQEHGCREPLVLWKGILLDGHNRHEICTRHNIPYSTVEYDFPNIYRARYWMFKNQKGRRNLNDFWEARFGLMMKEELKNEAKEIQLGKLKQFQVIGNEESTVHPNLGERIEKQPTTEGWTHRQIAANTGVSHGNIHKVDKILESGAPDQIKDLEEGNLSIHRAYEDIKKRERKIVDFPCNEKYQVFYCDPYIRDLTSLSGWRRKNFITKPDHLPVNDVRAMQAALFLWSPSHYLEKSLALMKSWGFSYEGMLIWKLNEPLESHQVLNSHIMIIIGTSGGCVPTSGFKPISVVEDGGQGTRQDQIRTVIEKMYPDGKKLELLAHDKKEGWDLYSGDGVEDAIAR